MQTPAQIEFQEMVTSPAIEDMIADHVKKLECNSMVALQHAGSSSKVPGIVTKPADCMKSIFDWRYRMVGKSISGRRRRVTSDIRIYRLPLTMRLSGQAGDCRIARGAWRGWSRATKGNPSELSYGLTRR
jgi:hypothetical protein